MPESFDQFLDKWLKQSMAQGLNNPLVKMPVKRFRSLQPIEFNSIANGGALVVGTMSAPVSRNLYKNFQRLFADLDLELRGTVQCQFGLPESRSR